jgi:hypothetical protein
MGANRTIKYHRRNYSLDDQTVEMARQMSDAMRLPVSALLRLLVRQAHQSQMIHMPKLKLQPAEQVQA